MLISDFIHFRDLDVDCPESWSGRRILSIDIDWAHDEVLEDTVNMIEQAGIKACFFVTHDTPLLSRLRDNPNFELGLHPNFDPLLRGEMGEGARDIIAKLTRIVPEATVLRSHAMTTSGRWLEVYREAGITHLSNYIMFGNRHIQPVRHINGLLEVPVYFADDGLLYQVSTDQVSFDINLDISVSLNGLQVYNFHPIHVFLNCENLNRYERARMCLDNPRGLRQMRSANEGVRTWLEKILTN